MSYFFSLSRILINSNSLALLNKALISFTSSVRAEIRYIFKASDSVEGKKMFCSQKDPLHKKLKTEKNGVVQSYILYTSIISLQILVIDFLQYLDLYLKTNMQIPQMLNHRSNTGLKLNSKQYKNI